MLKYLEENDLLMAVRGIEVTTSNGLCWSCHGIPRAPSWMEKPTRAKRKRKQLSRGLLHLQRLLPRMTGLKDIWWPDDKNLDAIIHVLPSQVRLHACVRGGYMEDKSASLSVLQSSTNLHAVQIRRVYSNSRIRNQLMEPLKQLVLCAPNLRSLSLDVRLPKGCIIPEIPHEYCGMGFVNGERPPALEHLRIDDYPFGRSYAIPSSYLMPHSQGYPGQGREEDSWVEVFDWSRLKSLHVHDADFAQVLIDALPQIRESCPLIETLRLDIPRSGAWPYATLDLLASFPRLHSLTMWFEIGSYKGLVEPKVTFSAVQSLFTYLHSRSPKIRELRVYYGCHGDIGYGLPAPPFVFRPEHESMEFLCRLSERDDEAAKDIFTCECPGLGDDANRALRERRWWSSRGRGRANGRKVEEVSCGGSERRLSGLPGTDQRRPTGRRYRAMVTAYEETVTKRMEVA